MVHSQGFSACIMIEGKPVVEYGVKKTKSDDGKTHIVTCHIASELGKKFSVNWTNESYRKHTRTHGNVKMDGLRCAGNTIHKDELPCTKKWKGVHCDDGESFRHFQFSALTLTDDETTSSLNSRELGVIELAMYPAKYSAKAKKTPSKPIAGTEKNDLPQIIMYEREKKGLTQQVSLAPPKLMVPLTLAAKPQTSKHAHRIGPDVVRFRFVYRPLDVLRADGIAVDPSPTKTDVKRKRKLEDQTHHQSTQKKPKLEPGTQKSKEKVKVKEVEKVTEKVKKENGPVTRRRNEVIDLT
ncbi:hypothetical protein C8F01DRAFT_725786 [Mycena amicta]|nr:hypothetical protein C8F01DRAFT_725786 [Mycena amicta]